MPIRRIRFAAVLVPLALSACAYSAASVPLIATARDAARLEGAWDGDYTGEETQRRGLITFRITAHGDSASGDVQMLLPDRRTVEPADRPDHHLQHVSSADFLDISFVIVQGGMIEGRLEPYRVPGRDGLSFTTFTGVLRGDVISGTFITITSTREIQRGTWQVRRTRGPRP